MLACEKKMASHSGRMSQFTHRHSRVPCLLAAAPFVVYTDHISLKYRYLQCLKVSAHNRLARWALALEPYKFAIEHEGKKLTAADSLSRRPYDEPGDLKEDEELQEDSFIAHTVTRSLTFFFIP